MTEEFICGIGCGFTSPGAFLGIILATVGISIIIGIALLIKDLYDNRKKKHGKNNK